MADTYPQYGAIDALERALEAAEHLEYEEALHETEAAASLLRSTILQDEQDN